MTTDIVERLRSRPTLEMLDGDCAMIREAADEIERLRERVAALQAESGYEASIAQVEIERLRAALQDIAVGLGEDVLGHDAMRARARHALSEGTPP